MLKKIECLDKLNNVLETINKYEPIEYITENHIKIDFNNKELYSIQDCNGNILAIASLVWDKDFNMHYIKRLRVFKEGNGYAKKMIEYLSNIYLPVAITPFESNKPIIKIISNLYFKYKYNFLKDYMLFIKE